MAGGKLTRAAEWTNPWQQFRRDYVGPALIVNYTAERLDPDSLEPVEPLPLAAFGPS